MAIKLKQKYGCRINWSNIENMDCIHLVNYGLHASTISKATGLTEAQIYYRAKQVGVKLRDYRDGQGPVASIIFRKFTMKTMSNENAQKLQQEVLPIIERRLQERRKRN